MKYILFVYFKTHNIDFIISCSSEDESGVPRLGNTRVSTAGTRRGPRFRRRRPLPINCVTLKPPTVDKLQVFLRYPLS